MRQQFKQMHRQMKQIRIAERTQILAALSPADKSLLAQVVGQLAVSPTPDIRGAVARLDAALSSSEKQEIVSAAQSAHTQMRNDMQALRKSMPHAPAGHPAMRAKAARTPDAGRILLHIAVPQGHLYGRFGHHR